MQRADGSRQVRKAPRHRPLGSLVLVREDGGERHAVGGGAVALVDETGLEEEVVERPRRAAALAPVNLL